MNIRTLFSLVILSVSLPSLAATYVPQPLTSSITGVQPFTGIVFWAENDHAASDAIQLEFSYMLYSSVVKEKGVYNWKPVDSLLDKIASRHHQAILRFRYVYPGYASAVPDYIKKSADFEEIKEKSEGLDTYFPDWRSEELKRFTLEFYTRFAEKYDHDPRLAFLQTGFGLWAEYHIYDGPNELGRTFPDKQFQKRFFTHLDTTFKITHWSVSIDAADESMSPLSSDKALVALRFGLFDDSFLCKDHGEYNTDCWNFFGRNRYLTSPAGGEISYYNDNDQKNALAANGPNGVSFEAAAKLFHISYMIGADQPEYQPLTRIKAASQACGYAFVITRLATTADSAEVTVKNGGIAPLYYDAFVAVNGVRSSTSLKLLAPDSLRVCRVAVGGTAPKVTIECDRLAPGQKIEFSANLTGSAVRTVRTASVIQHNSRGNARPFSLDGRVLTGSASAGRGHNCRAASVMVSKDGARHVAIPKKIIVTDR